MKSPDTRLHPKCERILRAIAHASYGWRLGAKGGAALVDGPEDGANASSDELYALLERDGSNPGFEGAAEIDAWIDDLRCYGLSDSVNAEQFVAGVVAEFSAPLTRHEFRVTLNAPPSAPHQIAGHLIIGGPNNLALDSIGDQGDAVTLSGVVNAATLETAWYAVPRLIDQVIAAMRALGLSCRVRPDRMILLEGSKRRTIEPATTRIHGGRASGEEFELPPTYALLLNGESLRVPSDLTELEQRSMKTGDFPGALARHVRQLQTLFAGESSRAHDLVNACRLALLADESDDFGVFIALAFSCMEGLLVADESKVDTVARLAEAVAYSLGNSFDERNHLRAHVKKLYKTRSIFVHTGKAKRNDIEWRDTSVLLYRVLRREIWLHSGTGGT